MPLPGHGLHTGVVEFRRRDARCGIVEVRRDARHHRHVVADELQRLIHDVGGGEHLTAESVADDENSLCAWSSAAAGGGNAASAPGTRATASAPASAI